MVQVGSRILQIEKTRWRATLAGCQVTVHEHLQGSGSITYGPHLVGRYSRKVCRCCWKKQTCGGQKRRKSRALRAIGIASRFPLSHRHNNNKTNPYL
jgi:hypothetical protein